MSIFEAAKSKPAAAPKPSKKKPEARRVAIKGLEAYAAVDAVMKNLKAVADTLAADIKTQMAKEFMREGNAIGRRPDNFKGVEGAGEASCELRVRSSRSVLTPEDVELFARHKVPLDIEDRVTETFVINPKYANDAALLDRVSKALEKVKDLPEDLILHQSEKVHVVTNDTMNALFAMTDKRAQAVLYDLAACPAIKPTLSADLDTAMTLANKALKG